jgi:hypothetical protein
MSKGAVQLTSSLANQILGKRKWSKEKTFRVCWRKFGNQLTYSTTNVITGL